MQVPADPNEGSALTGGLRGSHSAYGRRWHLLAFGTAALGSTLITFGLLHSFHSSDSLIPVLVSLQQWTFFYWDQDRFGMLVPLLAIPVRNPFYNLLVQGWLSTGAALLVPFLAGRWLLGAAGRWVTAGALTNILFVALVPLETQFDWLVTQPYAISMCLGFGALTLGTASRARTATAIFLMVLAHWVNFGVFVLLLPCLFAAPRQALRGLGLIALGAAAGLLSASLLGSSNSGGAILAPVAHWPTNWWTLLRNTRGLFWHRGWLAAAIIGMGWLIILARYQRLRRWQAAPGAVAIAVALFYWMVLGTTDWVRLNSYSVRYIYPSLLMLTVGFSILMTSNDGGDRLFGALPAVVGVLTLILVVHQPRDMNELKRTLNQRFGEMTTDILSTGATVVAGNYWTVWPAVFHANMARYRLTGRSDVFGLTSRSRYTEHSWRGQTVLMAVPSGDDEGIHYAEQLRLRLRSREDRRTLSLFVVEPRSSSKR